MRIAICFFCAALFGCGGEWESAAVGKTSCEFRNFNEFKPIKMSVSGDNLYFLDNFSKVHSYKYLYECYYDLQDTYPFDGFPSDVFAGGAGFYVQDRAQLRFMDDVLACEARDGVFAINGNELAVGSDMGIEIWSIKPCAKTGSVPSRKTLALAATGSEYYAVEENALVMYSKTGSTINSELLLGEKKICSADRIIANNFGVYILDKKCRKIGVFDNYAVWQRNMDLDFAPLDIAPAEHQYIFVLRAGGVEKMNVFIGK